MAMAKNSAIIGMAKPTRNWLRTNKVSSSGSHTPKRGAALCGAPGLPGIGRSVLYVAVICSAPPHAQSAFLPERLSASLPATWHVTVEAND
jgi:hypothetical protein